MLTPPSLVLQTLPLPNGSAKRNRDASHCGTTPLVSTDRTKSSHNLEGSLRRTCGSGGAAACVSDGYVVDGSKGRSGNLVGAAGSGNLREPATAAQSQSATPGSCRRATANHRGAAVVTTAGPPPRYNVSEYTFEQEHPGSSFTEQKESSRTKKMSKFRRVCILRACRTQGRVRVEYGREIREHQHT